MSCTCKRKCSLSQSYQSYLCLVSKKLFFKVLKRSKLFAEEVWSQEFPTWGENGRRRTLLSRHGYKLASGSPPPVCNWSTYHWTERCVAVDWPRREFNFCCSFPPCSAKWCSGTFLPVFFFIFNFCVKVHSLFEVQRPLCCQSNTTLSPSPIPLTFLSCKNGLLWFCRAVKELSLCLKGEAVPVEEMDAYKLLGCFS